MLENTAYKFSFPNLYVEQVQSHAVHAEVDFNVTNRLTLFLMLSTKIKSYGLKLMLFANNHLYKETNRII